jgi:beta-lactamase regulating signal transducer with metallopeptidase domain
MALFTSINPLYYTISWTVVHSIWQILLFTLIGGVAQALLHSKKATIKYTLLLTMVGLILASAMATFAYYYIHAQGIAVKPATPLNGIFASTTANQTESLITGTSETSFLSIDKFNQFVESNIYTIVILWLVGLVMALLRLVGNISYVYYLRSKLNFPVEQYWEMLLSSIADKLNVKKNIAILESALVRAPVVIGHLKPMILFPIGAINRLSTDEVESIITHELAHIKRNDYLVNIMLNIAESIFYFHPAMWWLSSQIKAEREHCCDDIAIATLGNPLKYAKSLVAVQEMAYYSPQLAMAFASKEKKSQLAIRINRLISTPTRVLNINEKGIASIFVLSMIVTFAIAARPGFNENPAHCIDLQTAYEKGNAHFLKFNNYTIMDSLFVPFPVADGDFDYNDDLHNVKMKIVGRHVVSFNLNGLEIAGTDISKFEKLIFEILDPQKDNENPDSWSTSNPVAFDGTYSTPDYAPEVYDAFLENLKKDNLLVKNKNNGVHFNARNFVINGKIMAASLHQKYIKLFETTTGRKMYGDVGMSFEVALNKKGEVDTFEYRMPDPPQPPAPESMSSGQSPTSPAEIPSPPAPPAKGINNGEYSNYNYTSAGSSSHVDGTSSGQTYASNYYSGSKEEAYDIWLDKQLHEDGYIKNIKQFSYYWDQKSMRVDGIEVSVEDRKKYAAKRKEMTGYDVSSTFMKTRNVTDD